MFGPNQRNRGNRISGVSPAWAQVTSDISAFVGQVIRVRFRYNTDGWTTNTGWYVDDVEPSDLLSTEIAVGSNLGQAQCTFPSHTTGTFSFLAQSIDAEGQVSAWSPPKSVVATTSSGVDGSAAAAPWRSPELQGVNPVCGETRLGFTVPASARVGDPLRLTVHDVTGRTVATLGDGTVGAAVSPGRVVENRLDVSLRPAGLYFARLEAGVAFRSRNSSSSSECGARPDRALIRWGWSGLRQTGRVRRPAAPVRRGGRRQGRRSPGRRDAAAPPRGR